MSTSWDLIENKKLLFSSFPFLFFLSLSSPSFLHPFFLTQSMYFIKNKTSFSSYLNPNGHNHSQFKPILITEVRFIPFQLYFITVLLHVPFERYLWISYLINSCFLYDGPSIFKTKTKTKALFSWLPDSEKIKCACLITTVFH